MLADNPMCQEQHAVVVMAWSCLQLKDRPSEQLSLTPLRLLALCQTSHVDLSMSSKNLCLREPFLFHLS